CCRNDANRHGEWLVGPVRETAYRPGNDTEIRSLADELHAVGPPTDGDCRRDPPLAHLDLGHRAGTAVGRVEHASIARERDAPWALAHRDRCYHLSRAHVDHGHGI